MARWWTPTTSAWAAPSAVIRRWRAPSAIAWSPARRRRPSSACCGRISTIAGPTRASESSPDAIATTSCAGSWPVASWPSPSATCRRAARRMASRAEGHGLLSALARAGRLAVPRGRWRSRGRAEGRGPAGGGGRRDGRQPRADRDGARGGRRDVAPRAGRRRAGAGGRAPPGRCAPRAADAPGDTGMSPHPAHPDEPVNVALVGAGPGDPGLMTVRGLALLRRADVVVYDRLVDPRLLDEARPDALCVFVGKASGAHTLPQREINALLVRHAERGRRVVRLKGGDPFVFGRGGEEAEALGGG